MLRIVQIIDTLEAGGAERMAVNYANSLSGTVAFSGLVATRSEGLLKAKLHPQVNYLCLQKRHAFDLRAVSRLYRYCQQHKINVLHAHSSSFFIAFLIKCIRPKIKIVWHDHYGMSDRVELRDAGVLKLVSYFFSGIIPVNHKLEDWARRTLNCSNIYYLENFVTNNETEQAVTILKGTPGKRILCLANLRPQKNHLLLLKVASRIKVSFPDWTFHLVGKDFEDDYSRLIKNKTKSENLTETVYFYGSRADVLNILEQSDVFVLTSESEGLPISLLEAGKVGKAVVVTSVGEIPNIIENGKNGFIVPSDDADSFCDALTTVMENDSIRSKIGIALAETVNKKYIDTAVINTYVSWLGKSVK